MIITTTQTIEGKKIIEYKGVVFGEVINGIHFMKDFAASITNFTGGRSKEYEQEVIKARSEALNEMVQRAEELGANAIVGVKVDIETINESMLMVTATGTSVLIEE